MPQVSGEISTCLFSVDSSPRSGRRSRRSFGRDGHRGIHLVGGDPGQGEDGRVQWALKGERLQKTLRGRRRRAHRKLSGRKEQRVLKEENLDGRLDEN